MTVSLKKQLKICLLHFGMVLAGLSATAADLETIQLQSPSLSTEQVCSREKPKVSLKFDLMSGLASVSWTAPISGCLYHVEETTDYTNWNRPENSQVVSTGSHQPITWTSANSDGPKYYRVIVDSKTEE